VAHHLHADGLPLHMADVTRLLLLLVPASLRLLPTSVTTLQMELSCTMAR
jgi:hypothetical protein